MKVDAQRDGSAIDARLDFAAEEWLPGVLPTAVISNKLNGPAHPFRVRLHSEIMQQLKRGERSDPRLPLALVKLMSVSRGKASASCPLALLTL
jgi:hypothetical protein